MKIVFFGSDDFSVGILRFLFEEGFYPLLVVTTMDNRGRSNPVKKFVSNKDVTLYQSTKISSDESVEYLSKIKNSLFVVASFGQLLSQEVLDLSSDAINVHPSILPRHRGASPIQSAILAGDDVIGTTIMRMVLKMDAGDILSSRTTLLPKEATFGEAREILLNLSRDPLLEVLHKMKDSRLTKGIPQNEGDATYSKKIFVKDSYIPWGSSSEEVHNFIRAMNPYPLARTRLIVNDCERLLKVYRSKISTHQGNVASIEAFDSSGWIVACGSGSVELLKVCIDGKPTLNSKDFINGMKEKSIDIIIDK